MLIYLNTFGTAVDILIYGDLDENIVEEGAAGGSSTMDHAKLSERMVSQTNQTGALLAVHKPGSVTFFRFTTADIQPQGKPFRQFPLFNNLAIGWSANVDFVIEMEFTILDANWDWREETMDLLDNKTMVEDPNIGNLQGKRSLVRAPLQIEPT